jgi:hypothetical protein
MIMPNNFNNQQKDLISRLNSPLMVNSPQPRQFHQPSPRRNVATPGQEGLPLSLPDFFTARHGLP